MEDTFDYQQEMEQGGQHGNNDYWTLMQEIEQYRDEISNTPEPFRTSKIDCIVNEICSEHQNYNKNQIRQMLAAL